MTAFFGPYAPELQGALRDFGQTTAYYDANGHYARISPCSPTSRSARTTTSRRRRARSRSSQGLQTGQLRRCPGRRDASPPADGSAPFTDNGQLGCDPTQVP